MTILLQQTGNSESLAQGDPPGTFPGKRLSPRPESVGPPGARLRPARPSQAARQGAVSHCGDDGTSLRAHCTPTPGAPGMGCSPTKSFPPLCLGFQPETEVLRVGPRERALCAGCGKPHVWGIYRGPYRKERSHRRLGQLQKGHAMHPKEQQSYCQGNPSPDTDCRASLPRPLRCHHNSARRCLWKQSHCPPTG